jgi:hypothetical protein
LPQKEKAKNMHLFSQSFPQSFPFSAIVPNEFCFKHPFSPWSSLTKLGSAHLAYRKVFVYSKKKL